MGRIEKARSDLRIMETKSEANVQRLGKLFEEQRTVNPSTEFRRRVDLHNKVMGLLNEMMDLEAKIMDTQNSLNNMENEELRKD